MPRVTTTEKLIELIKRSGLVSKEELAAFLARCARKAGGVFPADANKLGNLLVDASLMTVWQVEQLLKGKYRGFRLGKYTLMGHLGTGGMSSVYLSEHPIMRRPVAIKVLPKARVRKSSYLERFELEARAVAALDHPNIVRAYDIDNEDDTHYIVMEYVEGRDLQRMVEQEGPVNYERAADYIAQAAVGLQHAHEAGVVHRDIKPANCLVDTTGTVKVLDMGLAKIATDDQSLSALHKDSVVGTADYLAPEQAVNSSRVDSRADVYGLGGTLYFLLTGHPPFPQGTLTERLLKHQREEPASIYVDRPDAPPALVDLCRRMMMKQAHERIQTAAEVAAELHQWLAARGYGDAGGPNPATDRRMTSAFGKDDGRETASDRFQQMTASRSKTPPPVPQAPPDRAGETVSAEAADDTRRIQSEDDLTLAPLDDEDAKRADSGAGKSDVTDISPSDLNLDEQVLSQIEEEIGGESNSGSLVDLLHDNDLTSVSTSGVVLRRKQNSVPVWVVLSCAAGALVFVLLLIVLLVSRS